MGGPEIWGGERGNRARSLGLDLQRTMVPLGWKKGRRRSAETATFRWRRGRPEEAPAAEAGVGPRGGGAQGAGRRGAGAGGE